MAVYGYWRCFFEGDDEERQVIALDKAGCEKIYGDKINGNSDCGEGSELCKCLEVLQANDLLILQDFTILGQSMVTMLVEVNKLINRGVFIKTLDGCLDTSLMSNEIIRLIFGVMGYVAECETRNIKQRTAEGRAFAKTRGVKFGRKRQYDKYKVEEIMDKRKQGQGYGTIAKALGMNRSTVQKIVEREISFTSLN